MIYLDGRTRAEHGLEFCWSNLQALVLDHVLQTVDYEEVIVLIQDTDVACRHNVSQFSANCASHITPTRAVPAIVCQCSSCCRNIVEVAAKVHPGEIMSS